jgi:hypothetical protein
MIKLEDEVVDALDNGGYDCHQCGEPFGMTDDLDVEGDWDCVVGVDGCVYHSGCCVEAGKDKA